jgi:crossover junction endodeoxyribonuclease RuvC
MLPVARASTDGSSASIADAPLTRPPTVAGRVVGIDPGLNVTGYAIVEPGVSASRPRVVEAGVIRTGGASAGMARRLDELYRGILEVLDAYPPTHLALEQVHSHWKHPRTAILMAHARGVICLAAERRGVPVVGYAAARIKKSLTGSGKAPKDQMQRAIQTELGLNALPEPNDVADACAVALCHYQIERNRRALEGR